MSWMFLLLAGVLEVAWLVILRRAHDGHDWLVAYTFGPLCMIAGYFALLGATRSIPLGVAYAIWVGLGVVAAVWIDAISSAQPVSTVRALLVGGVVICAVGLKLTRQ